MSNFSFLAAININISAKQTEYFFFFFFFFVCSSVTHFFAFSVYYTRCDQNITVIFKFLELRMFDYRIIFFFCYVATHVMLLYMLTISAILDCQFDFNRLEG